MKLAVLTLVFLYAVVHAEEVYRPHSYSSTVITWRTVPDVDSTCKKEYEKLGKTTNIRKFLGCAIAQSDYCVIITGEHTTHDTIGHEVRHCFEGAFH
jgi:hypothetical protein